jgi:TonB family protein
MNLRMLLACWLWFAASVQIGALATPTPTQPPSLSPAAAQPAGTAFDQIASNAAPKVESSVRPAVILVTIFDPKGNLLRTETGFFISADGRVATTARGLEGGANAVAKTGDGGIYNVSGILTSSKELNLAVLQVDAKKIPFLEVNKNSNLARGTRVVLVGSALAGNDGGARETTIAAEHGSDLELEGTTPVSAGGSPLVNDAGELVGIVTSVGQKTVGRSSAALESLLSHITADTRPRWAASAEASPTPHSTPKPRLLYAPAPSFPPGFSQAGVSGTGRFRLSFDPKGNVTNVQVVKSTGNPYFDQSSMQTLRQWKSSPSQGWTVTVPVTFQAR